MVAHPHLELLHSRYRARSKGDEEALQGIIADNVVWHVAGKSQLSGDYRGPEAVLGLFAKMEVLVGDTLSVEEQDFLTSDERTAVLFRMTATRGNKTLAAVCCEVACWHNGQIIEAWGFTSDQYAFDEFWSSGWFSEAADGVWARRVKL
ncbi:MAG TPA: nuclear transport factor 2 family protein [Acidobacteria bacterium]|jgi:ketosteroid isomerase-like protein|nr:nuclear transport factor 2 family protein [Acidobacteriota bacterium]HIN69754.1 nuclear transport factor 2 family protein [Acidobacteriota bacterium]